MHVKSGFQSSSLLPTGHPSTWYKARYAHPYCNVTLWTEAGSTKKRATVGPTETQVKLRCPHAEFRVTTGKPTSVAILIAGIGFTMWSSAETMTSSLVRTFFA